MTFELNFYEVPTEVFYFRSHDIMFNPQKNNVAA
jgi:hypothetical protein